MHLLIAHVGQAVMLECKFQEMHHPPYSTDPALFPNLIKHLHGHRFLSNELKYATEEWQKWQSKPFDRFSYIRSTYHHVVMSLTSDHNETM